LLNDETYVETARVLAARTLLGEKADAKARVNEMFRRVASRTPESKETELLHGLYVRQRARFAADPSAAQKLMQVGESPRGRELDPVELAAWTVVAQAILNLDEVITRR
jgi:hypothetical protein